jgi:hypothetical protein
MANLRTSECPEALNWKPTALAPLGERGIFGTFHHVSKQHLHRYLSEFDFRYNARDTSDGERAELAVKGVSGKSLTCRDSCVKA